MASADAARPGVPGRPGRGEPVGALLSDPLPAGPPVREPARASFRPKEITARS